jgi:hypothetical protein
MTTGMHLIIYSKDADADKAFFRDVLKLTNVDLGHGWLIFGLPPSELAVHPSSTNGQHEIYLMCDNIKTFIREMSKQKIVCSEIQSQRWGQLVQVTLPGGGKLGAYQPQYARPQAMKLKNRSNATTAINSVNKKNNTKK